MCPFVEESIARKARQENLQDNPAKRIIIRKMLDEVREAQLLLLRLEEGLSEARSIVEYMDQKFSELQRQFLKSGASDNVTSQDG